jgi:uncharacterized membrane-anchored protein
MEFNLNVVNFTVRLQGFFEVWEVNRDALFIRSAKHQRYDLFFWMHPM